MLICLCIGYVIGLAGLIYIAYSRKHFSRYAMAKTALSCGFIAIAIIAAVSRGHHGQAFFWGLLPCLVLCMLGDTLLGLANTHKRAFYKWFFRGVITFTLAHAGFCAVFIFVAPGKLLWHWWDAALPAVLFTVTALCSRHKRFKLRRMHLVLPALIYSLCVGLMCARGFSFALASGFNAQGKLVLCGAMLFLLSDIILLFLYFYVRPHKATRAANLITYYLGMLCLALCV